MTYSFKMMLVIAAVVGIATGKPAPASLEKSDMNNEIIPSGAFVNKNGVSASWGGFQAGAALADDGSAVASAGGNGLGAGAGYGPGGAGAGASVHGVGAAASEAGYAKPEVVGKPGGPPVYQQGAGAGNGFFDRIFAIPINVLQSVNTYLNQKQQLQGPQHGPTTVNGGHNYNGASASASASATTVYPPHADKAPEAHVGAAGDYGHQEPSVGGKQGSPMMVHTKTNYDEIFNIPITALRSVQNLLNG